MRRVACAIAVLAFAGWMPALGETLRAKVPFNLEMNDAVLPAGEVQIDITNSCWVQISSSKGAERAQTCAHKVLRADAEPRVKLVIYKYGERAFLKEVWSRDFFQVIPRSRQERELVTSRITARVYPVRIEIAATAE